MTDNAGRREVKKMIKRFARLTTTAVIAAASLAFVLSPSVGQAETPDTFTRHGLPIPGAHFKSKESQKPATVAVSKSGQGIGKQKQTSKTVYFQTPAAKAENHGPLH